MAPTAHTDIRRSRVHMDGQARIYGPDGDFRAPLMDLSISGLHMRRPAGFALPVGQAVEVEVRCGPADAGVEFLLMARVARTDADTLGLVFAPLPERRLKLNVPSAAVVARCAELHRGGGLTARQAVAFSAAQPFTGRPGPAGGA